MAEARNDFDRDILIPYPGLAKPIRLAPGDVVRGPEWYIKEINKGHHGSPKPLKLIEPDPPASEPVISREVWEQRVADRAVIRASSERKSRGRPSKVEMSISAESQEPISAAQQS